MEEEDGAPGSVRISEEEAGIGLVVVGGGDGSLLAPCGGYMLPVGGLYC